MTQSLPNRVFPGFEDFEVTVVVDADGTYRANVRCPAGEASARFAPPFEETELEKQLLLVENAILRSGRPSRQALSPRLSTVRNFGEALFDALLPGDLQSLYYESKGIARGEGKGIRVKLKLDPPELAVLPWEFLFDQRIGDYVCLSTGTPIVRNIGLPQPVETVSVTLPLRILVMVSSPRDLPPINTVREWQRMVEALAEATNRGLIELHLIEKDTWPALQDELRHGGWHVFHFIGHGRFDQAADEGVIALSAEANGSAEYISATSLNRLLADEPALALAVLNSCEGATGGGQDIFASTASILLRGGVSAVVAMQYEITDPAAIAFSQAFYGALADGYPIDAAVSEARKAISLSTKDSLEWATPVLYLRAPEGQIFKVANLTNEESLTWTPPRLDKSTPSPWDEFWKPLLVFALVVTLMAAAFWYLWNSFEEDDFDQFESDSSTAAAERRATFIAELTQVPSSP
jgi:hypothetical protein